MAVINSSKFNFKEVVELYLARYGAEVAEELYEAVDEVSKESVTKLKKESPKATGEYRKGWKRKLDKGRLTVGATIYGDKPATYAVAHLLEYGHLTRGGTRKTAEIVHIKPVEEWAISELEDRIISKLEKRV